MVLQELSKDTVRLIKSTQVITTPVSVVKELLENSIDAGATTVSVRLENHGFTLVEVRDNGSGIGDDDVEFIAKPHFTSKISAFADLASLNTYGFRGEALASLCTVAEVSVCTKTKHSVMGHTYTFDHSGTVASKKPAATPNGTTIVARNLFKNLPVRKHYYGSTKRRKEELKKVEDLMLAFTLAAPGVHLTLSHDKCVILQKGSVNNIQEALMNTFPAIYKDLVLKENCKEDIRVEAYLPKSGSCGNPNLSRTTPERFFVMVNERPVIHKSIQKLVKAFYSQKLQGSHGRYPLGVVRFKVPPASVDINLEPDKTKILFKNENQVLEVMQDILSELYGPLDPSKSDDKDTSDLNHKIDITCTYGGFTQDSEVQEKEQVNSTQDVDLLDRHFNKAKKKNVSACNGKIQTVFTTQATVGDGIPVYKIPPLPRLDRTDNEHKNDDCDKLVQPEKDTSSMEALEDMSPFTTDIGDIQDDKHRALRKEKEMLETVQLLSTGTLGLKPPLSDSNAVPDAAKRPKRCVSLELSGMLATPPKKPKTSSLPRVSHEYIYGTPVKKPSSPFILFSRDVRRQVLSEYPGADFAFVAKQMADRWKTLDPDSKNHYQELAKAEADKYHREVKVIKDSRGSPLAGRCKTSGSLDRYIAPLTPYIKNKEAIQKQQHVADRPCLQHSKDVRCSLDIIRDKLKKKHSPKSPSDVMTIIGRVTASGGWICSQGSDIMALNVYRVYEVALYQNLLKTFKLSMRPLDDSLPFNASTVGMDNWAALLKLPRELVPDRNYYCITDQRLIANGFHVALFPGATASVAISHGEVTQMTDAVGFYGVADLKEILSVLTGSPLASLQQTRPLKLQHWIKAEAVRMVRSAPNILKQEDVLEKVKGLQLLLSGAEGGNQLPLDHQCIHGRPLLTKLYSLEELPCPKRKQRKILNKIEN
ncbi:PMS1 1 [Chionoecetes opilio]|uniref:PMS1 1 n=1 Tax=Chionoecetes opilio TaxID=41210 RepID=A0A8J4YQH2_CHIOP|nr:PMS1 1 [Chionoecetes opilio]